MDAELQKDIERLKWYENSIKRFIDRYGVTGGDSPSDKAMFRRTIDRLEALAVGGGREAKAEAELAAALEELAANKCVADLLNAAMTHLAAAQQREAKLRELCNPTAWVFANSILAILNKKGGE